MKYQDKWGSIPSNDIFVKGDNLKVRSFRTKNEKIAIKRNTLKLICFTFITFTAIVFARSGELFSLVKFAGMAFIAYCVLSHLLAFISRDQQRKRITLKSESIQRQRECRKLQSQFAEQQRKIAKEAEIAKEEEILDKRLEEAMKPIDWDSYKPKKAQKVIKKPTAKKATNSRVKPVQRKRPKTFKAVDLGDV